MIENQKDKQATRDYRRAGVITDRRSYVSIAGHIYLRGEDRSRQRDALYHKSKGVCAVCGKKLSNHEADYDHIEGGRKHARCDCWNQLLADGTTHTNVRIICGMAMPGVSCHRQKHGRYLVGKIKAGPL